MVIYNPDIPKGSPNLTSVTPRYGTHSFTVSSLLGEWSTFSAAVAIHTVPNFCSTWYPLLLGGQRRCGFKACPRLLHMTSATGIEPQTPWSWVIALTTSQCIWPPSSNGYKVEWKVVLFEWLQQQKMHCTTLSHVIHLQDTISLTQTPFYTRDTTGSISHVVPFLPLSGGESCQQKRCPELLPWPPAPGRGE